MTGVEVSDLSHDSPGVQGLAQLGRNAIERVSELERGIAERDETIRQLRAQLDEYERAPAVATVCVDPMPSLDIDYLNYSAPLPPVGTELIARPAQKEST